MKDIARIAGVSRQAVAAALSDTGTSKVSEDTRQRVREIAEKLHYVPNQNAKRLRGCSSKTIGLYGNPYATVLEKNLFYELSVELSHHEYNLTIGYSFTETPSDQAIRNLLSYGVDGVIILSSMNPMTKFKLDKVPYVFTPGAGVEGFDVVVDHAAGTREAMKALIAEGSKKTVFLAPDSLDGPYQESNRQKYQGIVEALEETGVAPVFLTIEECGGDSAAVVERLRQLAPDIVFCVNDFFAGTMISFLLEAGIRVPQDMKVIGYDGLSICDMCAVPLATVVQPLKKRAEIAVGLLLERIKAGKCSPEPAGIRLPSRFHPSTSCGFENKKTRKFPSYRSFTMLETD